MQCDLCKKSQPMNVEWYEIKKDKKIVLLCPECLKKERENEREKD